MVHPSGVHTVELEEVLRGLGINHEQYVHAYCLSGCDDVTVKLNGIGFKSALVWAKKGVQTADDFCDSFPRFDRSDINRLFEDIRKLKELHAASPSSIDKFDGDVPECNAIESHLRRGNGHAILLQKWLRRRDPHPASTPTAPPVYTPGHGRAVRATQVGKIVSRPFSFPYTLLWGNKQSEVLPVINRRKRKNPKKETEVDGEMIDGLTLKSRQGREEKGSFTSSRGFKGSQECQKGQSD